MGLVELYLGLEVSVDKVLLVHVLQSPCNLGCDQRRLGFREIPFLYVPLEVAMLDELHGDVQVGGILEPAKAADEMLLVLCLLSRHHDIG